jgi:hypothetical protein
MLDEHPPNLKNRETLSTWLVDRHNDINKRLNKPIYPYDFVQKKYHDMQNTCPSEFQNHDKTQCICPDESTKKEMHLQKTDPLLYAILVCLIVFIILLVVAIAIFLLAKK